MSTADEWSKQSAIDYYAQHRHEVSDLYPSEKVFLPRVLFPGIKVLFTTGYSGDVLMGYGAPGSEGSLIQKPFTPVDLARKVREALDVSQFASC